MSKTYIPVALRRLVTQRAQNRCSYCQTQADIIGQALQVDHSIPEAAGGKTDETNLCLACVACNQRKAFRTLALDRQTGETVPLFNPIAQSWVTHFRWSNDGIKIVGLTATGRATIDALQLNRSLLVKSRKRWVLAGWHPPQD